MSQPFDIVVIGASLGGLRAIQTVLSCLPVHFPAALVVVLHISDRTSALLSILNNHSVSSSLPVKWAQDGEFLQPSHVYIAPPNAHVEIDSNRMISLSTSPKVSFARPSVDVLFRSAATSFGSRAISVILTGMLHDGAKGVDAIKAAGGWVLVEDPATAFAPSMPLAAIRTGHADFVLSLDHIASALTTLVMVEGATRLFSGSMPYTI